LTSDVSKQFPHAIDPRRGNAPLAFFSSRLHCRPNCASETDGNRNSIKHIRAQAHAKADV
jgi:hypothetical protein